MADALSAAGYVVSNVSYPSRSARIEVLAERAVGDAVAACERADAAAIHFVTHSLGGILVRCYLGRHTVARLGRVVMLGPPNRGSEVVDRLRDWALFRLVNGPAGSELGTDPDSVPNRLGPVSFELGVIAGRRSVNLVNSTFIAGPNDGKVSVERTRVAGMADHLVLPVTHPFMMKNREAIRQTIAFLRLGRFERPPGEPGAFARSTGPLSGGARHRPTHGGNPSP